MGFTLRGALLGEGRREGGNGGRESLRCGIVYVCVGSRRGWRGKGKSPWMWKVCVNDVTILPACFLGGEFIFLSYIVTPLPDKCPLGPQWGVYHLWF